MPPLKLNVGCGTKVLDGYENLDLYADAPAVKRVDIENLPYADGSVDEILAEDIIEHFPRLRWKTVLIEWYRTLKPGGIIVIQTPDMPALCHALINAKTPEEWEGVNRRIFGGQGDGRTDGAGMFHYTGFSPEYLCGWMEKYLGAHFVGFSKHNMNFTLTMRKPE